MCGRQSDSAFAHRRSTTVLCSVSTGCHIFRGCKGFTTIHSTAAPVVPCGERCDFSPPPLGLQNGLWEVFCLLRSSIHPESDVLAACAYLAGLLQLNARTHKPAHRSMALDMTLAKSTKRRPGCPNLVGRLECSKLHVCTHGETTGRSPGVTV